MSFHLLDGICVDLIKFEKYTPYEILVDVQNDRLFWVGIHDSGLTSIETARLDGGHLTTLAIR